MVPGNVLMVCLGNICRSPLAHGIFQNLVADQNIKVDSAGTANYHTGAAPDPRSIEIATEHDIDISRPKSPTICGRRFRPVRLHLCHGLQ